MFRDYREQDIIGYITKKRPQLLLKNFYAPASNKIRTFPDFIKFSLNALFTK